MPCINLTFRGFNLGILGETMLFISNILAFGHMK